MEKAGAANGSPIFRMQASFLFTENPSEEN